MTINHATFTLGALTWQLFPHPDNASFLKLEAKDEDGDVIASAQIATNGEGLASIDLRATTDHLLTASVGGADGSLQYQGTA